MKKIIIGVLCIIVLLAGYGKYFYYKLDNLDGFTSKASVVKQIKENNPERQKQGFLKKFFGNYVDLAMNYETNSSNKYESISLYDSVEVYDKNTGKKIGTGVFNKYIIRGQRGYCNIGIDYLSTWQRAYYIDTSMYEIKPAK